MIRRHLVHGGNSVLPPMSPPLALVSSWLHNVTTGDFHGNLTYGTMLGTECHVPLIDYQSPKDPPSILYPLLPCCPRVPQMPTSVGLPIPLEYCQPVLGVKFTGDYLILSSNLTLGMWRFTPHDAYNITPYVHKNPIRF